MGGRLDLGVGGLLSGTISSSGTIITIIDSDNNDTTSRMLWKANGNTSILNQIASLSQTGNLRIRGFLTQNATSFDLAESFLASESLQPGDIVRLDPSQAGAVRKSAGSGDRLVIGVVSEKPGNILGGVPFDRIELKAAWGAGVAAEFAARRNRLQAQILAAHPEKQRKLQALHAALAAIPAAKPQEAARIKEQIRQLEEDLDALIMEAFFKSRISLVALAGRVPVKADASFGAIEPGDLLTTGPEPGVAVKFSGSRTIVGKALGKLDSGRGKVLMFVQLEQGGHDSVLINTMKQQIHHLRKQVEQAEQKLTALQQQLVTLRTSQSRQIDSLAVQLESLNRAVAGARLVMQP